MGKVAGPSPDVLTQRERAMVPLLVQDVSVRDLAGVLACTAEEVQKLRDSVYAKLRVSTRSELAEWALQNGVT